MIWISAAPAVITADLAFSQRHFVSSSDTRQTLSRNNLRISNCCNFNMTFMSLLVCSYTLEMCSFEMFPHPFRKSNGSFLEGVARDNLSTAPWRQRPSFEVSSLCSPLISICGETRTFCTKLGRILVTIPAQRCRLYRASNLLQLPFHRILMQN